MKSKSAIDYENDTPESEIVSQDDEDNDLDEENSSSSSSSSGESDVDSNTSDESNDESNIYDEDDFVDDYVGHDAADLAVDKIDRNSFYNMNSNYPPRSRLETIQSMASMESNTV